MPKKPSLDDFRKLELAACASIAPDKKGYKGFLSRNRVVFNIGGNKYRLVVKMEYQRGEVYVRHVVTHQDYDELTRANEL
jgi:mRNA-degrading endonuclease HigB of HigAB toxin-antitoxin module